MAKRLIMMALLIAIASVFCACGTTERWPRVCIEPTRYRFDYINIPLRDGYKFAEDVYDIAETEAGYDIIIHVEVFKESEIQGEATPWNLNRVHSEYMGKEKHPARFRVNITTKKLSCRV